MAKRHYSADSAPDPDLFLPLMPTGAPRRAASPWLISNDDPAGPHPLAPDGIDVPAASVFISITSHS